MPSVLITQTGLNTAVTEGGATDNYTVVLSQAPTADVTITLDNTNKQVTTDVSTLTFTTTNWATPQTVTVTAANDTRGEGQHTGVIKHSVTSTGSNYDGVAIDNLIVTVTDNDLATGLRNYVFLSTATISPFGLTDAGSYAHPTFADIDSDGDLDAFIGNQAGNTLFFQNTGTTASAAFAAAVTNPFALTNVGTYSTPTFVDIDGDGDLDAFVGNKAGDAQFFQNTGTATNPAFAAAVTNPFGLTNVGNYANPTFADIDGDGDLDAFIGKGSGDILFFENTGTATNPAFAASVTNPFGLTAGVSYASPALVDIDGDGDLDVFIKDIFLKNTGSASSPVFAAGVSTPLGITSTGSYPNPTFADIDSDGDFDVFFGIGDGNTTLNSNAPTAPTITNLNNDSSAWAGVGGTVLLDKTSNATVSDLEMDIIGWNAARLTVQRIVGSTLTPLSSDLFSFNASGFTVSGANLQTGGSTTFATFTNTNGVLTIDFNASATNTLVRDVIRGILYRNDTPTGNTSIRFSLIDNESQTTTANVTITSSSIYVTNATDTATSDVSDGVSFSEAVAIAATISGNQTLVLGSGSSTTLAGNLSIGESVTVNADAVSSGTVLTGSTVTIGSGFTLAFTNASGKAATIASVLAGAGALTKTGAGTLTLSGANTYTGNTTISAGGLTTGGAAKIADTSAVSVASGATLTLGGDETIGSLSSAGSVALGSYILTTGAKNTSTTFSGILSGSGGLTKTGSGTFTLSGTNTYTGSTTISAGGLTTSGVARIADTSAVSVASGATFTVGGAETIGSLAGAGNVALGANTLTAGGDNTSTTFSGAVAGTGGLAKAGTGTLTLSGTETYSGATSVNAGMLAVNGTLSNTSTVTVASGATLGGTGSIGTVGTSGAVTVQSGGTLGPGNSVGTLTLNNGLTAASGSTLSMELNGTTAGSGYDRIVVKGSVNVSSATLVTNLGFTPAVGDSFTLIDNDGTDAITGSLKVAGNSIAEGGTFSQGGKVFQVSYIGGTGNDLVLSVTGNVPVIDTSDPPAPPVVVNPPAPTVKDDGDNIPPEKESAVPTLPPGNGGTAVVGDGNGDGKADSEQANVTSVPFLKTDTAQSAPGDAKPVYVTLVSDSVAGKTDTTQTQTSVLKEVQQLDAPAGKPTDLDMPLGQISFKTQVAGTGVQENFSLYVDGSVAVNGYWKQNSAGAWVNLASAQYGGKVVSESGKTRLDFQIVDGGEFDDDGKADGIISDPGAPGYRAVADSDNDQFPDALETMHGLKVGVKDNNVFGSNKLFVMELYRDILFREADSGGQAYWQTRMDSGELNRAQVASMFMDSVESEGGAHGIAHLYFGALGRLPDAATLDSLMDKRLSGTSLVGIADSLVAGAEFAGKFTAQDNTGFVNQLYQNVLHRAPEQAGIDYWTHQLAAGARRGEVLLGFTESAEFKAASDHYVTVGLNYLELLGRAPEQTGLESWRGLLDQGTAEVTIVGGFMAAPEYHDRFLS